MEKLLTIIVPTYNMASICDSHRGITYLDRCLTSLIIDDRELLQSLEVLVVNDGSKDDSLTIAAKYASLYPLTIRVIDKKNGNYGSCINAALPLSTGKYIKILDADDFFDAKVLERYLLYLNKVDVDLIFSNICFLNQITGERTFFGDSKEDRDFSFEEFLSIRSHTPFIHSLAYNRRVFDKLDYFQTEGISYTDSEWTAKPMSVVQTCRFFDGTLYYYISGREGQTMNSTIMQKSVGQWITVTMSLCKIYAEYEGDELHKQYLRECFIQSVSILYCSDNFISIRKESVQDFEKRLANQYPQVYKELDTYRMDRSAFEFIQCYRHPWHYIINKWIKEGGKSFWWQFDKANFHHMLKPMIIVNFIYKAFAYK